MSMPPSRLARLSFFRDLKPEHATLIAPCCLLERFRRGQRIFTQGDEASTVYILQAGEVELHFRPAEKLNYSVTTSIVRPGEAFGCSAALGRSPYSSTAISRTDARALAISSQDWRLLTTQNESLGGILDQRMVRTKEEHLEAMSLALWLAGLP